MEIWRLSDTTEFANTLSRCGYGVSLSYSPSTYITGSYRIRWIEVPAQILLSLVERAGSFWGDIEWDLRLTRISFTTFYDYYNTRPTAKDIQQEDGDFNIRECWDVHNEYFL